MINHFKVIQQNHQISMVNFSNTIFTTIAREKERKKNGRIQNVTVKPTILLTT